jgi:hypothetical protein
MVKRRRRRKGSTSAFFRNIFEQRPDLLDSKSNEELRKLWLEAHPNQREVPKKVIQNLSNLKSVLRKKGRKKGRRAGATQVRPAPRGLEALEVQIDECMTVARNLDREGLEEAIHHLRRARNQVVWKQGE